MTAQISENLIFGTKHFAMCTEPLDFWLNNSGNHINLQANSSACWRGYIGTWKIINDRLYLIKIKGNSVDGFKLKLKDFFPDNADKVFAHWFSGEVRCPYGKILNYVHMGYASKYENDLYLKFLKGVLINKRIVRNSVSEDSWHDGLGINTFVVDRNTGINK